MVVARRLLLALLGVLLLHSGAIAQQTIHWETSLDGAKRIAAQSNRLVLVVFSAPWCSACRAMEAEVLGDPAVVAALDAHYVPARLNADYYRGTAGQYGVSALPTTIILAPGGREEVVDVIRGNRLEARQFAARLNQIAANARQRAPVVLAQIASGTAVGGSGAPGTVSASAGAPSGPPSAVPGVWGGPVAGPTPGPPPIPPPPPVLAAPPVQSVQPPPVAGQGGAAVAAAAGDMGPPPATPPSAPVNPSSNPAAEAVAPPPAGPPPAPAADGPASPPPFAMRPQPPQPPQPFPTAPVAPPLSDPPIGLDGYCPVQLVEKAVWSKGDKRWGAVHRGRTYLFAGQEEQQRFLAAPDRYAPVDSGNDVVLALELGRSVPGTRDHGISFGGRVYLFADEASLERFSKNPKYYAERASQAMLRGSWPEPQIR